MSNNGCTCGSCGSSDAPWRERPRFFPRQMVGAADLGQISQWALQRMRTHNRLLHGWGIVCGARVRRGDAKGVVVVEPGYVLGPFGDEIVLDADTTVDLATQDSSGNAVTSCADAPDQWCNDVRTPRRPGQRLYLAIKFDECAVNPVRVPAGGCGCDEAACEYSRIRDGFAIRVLSQLPSTYATPMPEPDPATLFACPPGNPPCGRACAPCPGEPWVILADLILGADGDVAAIDCFTHRRYVASFADFYYLCKPGLQSFTIQPASVVGGTAATGTVTLNGPAPIGGAQVAIASDQASAKPPATVVIKAGEIDADFDISTDAVPNVVQATLTAKWKDVALPATLQLTLPIIQ